MPKPQASYYGDVYDSESQSQIYQWNSKGHAAQYKGRLRLDAFLNREVVLRDSDLFDGRYFLDQAKQGLIRDLPLKRIKIALRSGSLKDSILRAFKQQGRKHFVLFFSIQNRNL